VQIPEEWDINIGESNEKFREEREVTPFDDSSMDQEFSIEKLDSMNYSDLIDAGKKFMELGRITEAIKFFKRAIDLNPVDTEARYLCGVLLFENKQYDEAAQLLGQATDLNPYYYDAWHCLEESLIKKFYLSSRRQEDTTAVADSIKKASTRRDAVRCFICGLDFAERKQHNEAVDMFHNALHYDGKDPLVLYHLGIAFYNLKKFKMALSSFDRAIDIKSDLQDLVLVKYGLALLNIGRYQEAILWFQRAMDKDPKNPELPYFSGRAFYGCKDFKGAIAMFDKAVKIKVDYEEAYHFRGNAYFDLKNYEAAISSYENACRYNPYDASTWNNLGNAFYRLKRYEEAITSYNSSLDIDSENGKVWNNKIEALGKLERFEDIIVIYGRMLNKDPKNAQILNDKGKILYKLGRYDEAEKNHHMARIHKSDFFDAWNNEGKAQCKLGKYEEAAESFRMAIFIKQDYTEAIRNRKIALKKHEDTTKNKDQNCYVTSDQDDPMFPDRDYYFR
jgi:tetratricopeptide (TPR) repeat protein